MATFLFVVAYWQTFDKACPKYDPLNGSIITKLAHETIELKPLA
jgi:hypothetical protein